MGVSATHYCSRSSPIRALAPRSTSKHVPASCVAARNDVQIVSEPRWIKLDVPRPSGVSAEATSRSLRVPPEFAGMRLDVFLSLMLRGTSRTRAKRIAKSAAFRVDGTRIRPNQRLKPEEQVVLWRVPMDEADPLLVIPEIYRDEHILVVNKPPHLTVHPTASHYHHTVTKALECKDPGQ